MEATIWAFVIVFSSLALYYQIQQILAGRKKKERGIDWLGFAHKISAIIAPDVRCECPSCQRIRRNSNG